MISFRTCLKIGDSVEIFRECSRIFFLNLAQVFWIIISLTKVKFVADENDWNSAILVLMGEFNPITYGFERLVISEVEYLDNSIGIFIKTGC